MKQVILVTGANHGLGYGIVLSLLQRGHKVLAGVYPKLWHELDALQNQYGDNLILIPMDVSDRASLLEAREIVRQYTDHLDVIINNAGVLAKDGENTIEVPFDEAAIVACMQVNTFGPMRVTEIFLPLLEQGTGKRLCYVSSEAGSVGECFRDRMYGYCMSKGALNNAVAITFNCLRPKGYTFRCYHPGWVRSYMSGHKGTEADLEPEEAGRLAADYFLGDEEDEDVLRLRGYDGKVWSW